MARAQTILLAVLILASAFGWSVPVPRVDAPGSEPCDGVLVPVAPSNSGVCIKPGSGESFKDCPECPEMVVVPAGRFMMGLPENERLKTIKLGNEVIDKLITRVLKKEAPQHLVAISGPFAVGKFAVTFTEWDACVEDGGCGGYRPDDKGWGRGDRPVINVSWNDAKAYTGWLLKKTGHNYRLLTEAEREYAARAGTTTPFWWGTSITPAEANYMGRQEGEYRNMTVPVQSFKPNPWGLYQVHGNVHDWVEDCWHDSYESAPADGAAWTSGECKCRVLRGSSWADDALFLHTASRYMRGPGFRHITIGFRVARAIAH